MRTFDLTPLFRSTIGFDRMTHLLDSAMRGEESSPYPPYNIEKWGEDRYRISMAVAGFGPGDLDIVLQDNTLTVTGKSRKEDDVMQYLHRGIAGRGFERRFQLADHIKVTGAKLENGLLFIDLVREIPEAMKPRSIKIETTTPGSTKLEHHAA